MSFGLVARIAAASMAILGAVLMSEALFGTGALLWAG